MKLILFTVIFLFSFSTFAAKSKQKKNILRKNKITTKIRYKKRKIKAQSQFAVGLSYGLNQELFIAGSAFGERDATRVEKLKSKSLQFFYNSRFPNKLKYNLGLVYSDLEFEEIETDENFINLRLVSNVKQYVSEVAHLYAGLNAGRWIDGDGFKDLDIGIGYQVGVEFLVHKNFEMNIQYSRIQNRGKLDSTNIDIALSSINLGANYKF